MKLRVDHLLDIIPSVSSRVRISLQTEFPMPLEPVPSLFPNLPVTPSIINGLLSTVMRLQHLEFLLPWPPCTKSNKSNEKPTKLKPINAKSEEEVIGAYLKRVLLQFFLQDESKRSELVPLILELAGCTEQQIMAATRQWERSVRLASKSTSIFGFWK